MIAHPFFDAVHGHAWTILPALRDYALPPRGARTRRFSTTAPDPRFSTVRLTGHLSEIPGADTIALIVHGLGGSAESAYCTTAERAAQRAGISSLRLSLRGADGSGEDIFHGGLTADLWAALASPALASYRRVVLIGYSVGGHIAMRAAVERLDSRLTAAAAVCPPLDLAAASTALDALVRRFYRSHVFASLDDAYEITAARRGLPVPAARVRRARTARERDDLTVVPRFGFRDAADYYARQSAIAWLHRLEIPALVVATRADPVVPSEATVPAIAHASKALTFRFANRGGHVYFPANVDLGLGLGGNAEEQIVRWLLAA